MRASAGIFTNGFSTNSAWYQHFPFGAHGSTMWANDVGFLDIFITRYTGDDGHGHNYNSVNRIVAYFLNTFTGPFIQDFYNGHEYNY